MLQLQTWVADGADLSFGALSIIDILPRWSKLRPVWERGVGRAFAEEIRQLFALHGPAVYRRALRIMGNAQDAEDATQEVFIRAFRGVEAFQQRSQLTTWLYQITTHYCLNQLRDRSRRNDLRAEQGIGQENPEVAARAEEVAIVRRLLADAEPREAQAAVFVFIDGMSHEEASEVLGVSKRTVGNLIERFRARAQAQAALPGESVLETAAQRRSGS